MDLQLYLRVLWRFRILVGAGVLLAFLLALLAMVRIAPTGDGPLLQYRQDEQWVSYATLFVTQEGFPWGQLSMEDPNLSREEQRDREQKIAADPNRFSSLAVLYAHLATSDPVRKILLEGGPLHGEIDAAAVEASDNAFAGTLPLVRIAAIADSEQHAIQLVMRTTKAFQTFLQQQQVRNKIPEGNRVLVTVVKKADKPQLFAGRSLTLPIVVFTAVMVLVSALAFILENLRPRLREVIAAEFEAGEAPEAASALRSA